MPEEKAEAEVLKKLEEDMRERTKQIQEILGKLQAESEKSPEELVKKVGDAKDVKVVADAVKEMQQEVGEKRQLVETVLKNIQKDMESLRALKGKSQKEDVTEEVKSLLIKIRDRKIYLEKMINEAEELKTKYTKKFLG